MLLRAAQESDASAISEIYGHYVRSTCFTFEEIAPAAEEIVGRMRKTGEAGLSFVVAEVDGVVGGYAYASPFHSRSAYRFTVENSVYVAEGLGRRGIGSGLMIRVIEECTARGCRQMIGRIGDTQNIASLALHEKLGFARVGVLRDVGFKFGRWLDVVEVQRALSPPA